MMYRNKFLIVCFTVSVSVSINDRSKTDFDRAKIKLTGHFDRRPISIDILYTLDSASNYSAIQKLKP